MPSPNTIDGSAERAWKDLHKRIILWLFSRFYGHTSSYLRRNWLANQNWSVTICHESRRPPNCFSVLWQNFGKTRIHGSIHLFQFNLWSNFFKKNFCLSTLNHWNGKINPFVNINPSVKINPSVSEGNIGICWPAVKSSSHLSSNMGYKHCNNG